MRSRSCSRIGWSRILGRTGPLDTFRAFAVFLNDYRGSYCAFGVCDSKSLKQPYEEQIWSRCSGHLRYSPADWAKNLLGQSLVATIVKDGYTKGSKYTGDSRAKTVITLDAARKYLGNPGLVCSKYDS